MGKTQTWDCKIIGVAWKMLILENASQTCPLNGNFERYLCPEKHLFYQMKRTAVLRRSEIYLLWLLLVMCPAISSFAQAPAGRQEFQFVFGGKVTEFDEKKGKDVPVDACSVNLYKGTTLVSTNATGSNGKFKVRVDHDGDYVLQITKPGYITKRIAINTFNVPDERTNAPFAEFDVDIDLFKLFPGLDYSVLDKPIARIIYNPQPDVDDFDYDKVYTSQIQAQLDKLKELARQAREKLRLYQVAIDAADKLFNAGSWQEAKDKYNEALGILPNEQYPKDQIAKCDEKMGASAAEKKKYDDAMAAGNALFDQKKYADAKAKFQEAQALRPAEPLPPQRIKACDDALAGAATEQKYQDAIKDADAKFLSKDYAGAKAKYSEASGIKPAEQYPKDRMKACDEALAAAAKEKQYTDAIAAADAKFTAKDYAGAKAGYQQASGMKPEEQYPKDRIKACDDAMGAAAKDKQYADAIAEADKKFDAKDFAGAKAKYQEAAGIKPAETYPPVRIKACDDALAAAAKDKSYNDAVADADAKFTAKDFTAAKAKYQEASGIKPTEQYPKDRMKACDDALAGAAKDKAYADAIAAADAKFTANDFTGARSKYAEASGIKPAEQYPKDRMKACDDAMGAAAKEKAYKDAIAAADAKFDAKDFAGAKAKYTEASGLKPTEQYPKDKIKACDDAIAAAGKEKQYNDLIKQADTKFTAKDWAGAKTIYTQASGVKPEEQYPKDRIKACDDALAAAGLDKQYNDLIKSADTKFTAKDFAGAKTIYQQASDLKTSEQYPKDRIKACDDAMGAAAIDAQYKDLIKQADTKFTAKDYTGAKDLYTQASGVKPTEQYPKDKIKAIDDLLGKEESYKAAIADADKKFDAKDWANAKTKYQEASGIKPAEQYPKDRIKACDDAIAAAAKDKAYTDAIAAADSKFDAKDFAAARSKYAEASALKPAEQYPKDRMKLCDDQMGAAAKEKAYTDAIAAADAKFTASDFAGAKLKYSEASGLKPTEQYPKDKIKACDDALAAAGLEKQYNDLIKQADAKFTAKAYADAKTIYGQASALKTSEQYPKDRIKACDDALGAAVVDAQYKDLIKQADTKFTAKDFTGARDLYSQASGVKPAEQYPKDRMKACDDAMGAAAVDAQYKDLIKQADTKFTSKDWAGAKEIYTQAGALKTAETYPPQRIKACDDAIAKDKQYADAIADADKKFDAKDFTGARSKYAEASGLKPTEQYPKDRMKLCDDQMGAAAKEKAYTDAIAAADAKFTASDWAGAKAKYTEASGLKPAEQYPKDRIKACDDAIAAAGKDKQYNDLIKSADTKFTAKDYAGAKLIYTQASGVKPEEQYPKDRIKACDDAIGLAGIDKQYNDLIKSADAKFALKDYAGAKPVYEQASGVKPAEQYPKDRMKACDDAIAGAKDKAYNDVIAAADAKFKASDWAGAKAKYNEAIAMRATEQYPKDQVKICDENIAAMGVDKQYASIITAADALFTAKNWEGAKAKYTEALGVKPNESYPKERIKACDDNIGAALGAEAKYKKAIARGDSAMAVNDLETAQSAFTSAKDMKPAEAYPKQKLDEISKLLAANSKDKAYRALIAQGDSLFNAKNYLEAKKVFTTATVQKASDQYPKDRITEINRILSDQKTDADHQKKYDAFMAQANKKFEAKDYKGAKALYQQALNEKPLELEPKTQIAKCDDLLNPKTVVVKDPNDPKNKDEYISELVKKYPQGVTSSSATEDGSTIETRVVVVGNKGWKYQKKIYSFGTYYFKDGVQVSEQTYNYETSAPYVQQQQAEYDKNNK
jgi:methylmalonyl-CoA mutase cobalamin-binding subunit